MVLTPDEPGLQPYGERGEKIAHDDKSKHDDPGCYDEGPLFGKTEELIDPGKMNIGRDQFGLHYKAHERNNRSQAQSLEKGHHYNGRNYPDELYLLFSTEQVALFSQKIYFFFYSHRGLFLMLLLS